MTDLQELKKKIDAACPGAIIGLTCKEMNAVSEVRYTKDTSEETKAAIQAIIDGFDWDAPPPDIAGFFNALGRATVFDQSLPFEVYVAALILKDQKELKSQQMMLEALAANPSYTKEQKIVLNALLKQFGLLLPEVKTE